MKKYIRFMNLADITLLKFLVSPNCFITFNTTPIKILLGDVTEIYATS